MKRFFPAVFFLAFSGLAFAQENPVEITAKNSLEWNRAEKTYVARGSAVARQGKLQVSAQTLSAFYSEAGGGTDITRLAADGGVVIQSPPYTAHGDAAVYDLAAGMAVLIGKDLQISTPEETLTAREKIEFFSKENRLSAIGDAVARRGTDTLKAKTLTAWFAADVEGKTTLRKMAADGEVAIVTARETVYGDSGIYDVAAGKATLTGRVRIYQGESWIEGTRADVDLNTGMSKLFAEEGEDGRVRGVFYPKKQPQQ